MVRRSHRPSNLGISLTYSVLIIGRNLLSWSTLYDGRRSSSLAALRPLQTVPPSHADWVDIRYGEVDYIYGWKAYENHNGFTNAQSALNVLELLLQIYFLRLRTKPGKEDKALMVGYTVSVMTLSKTILYWLQEYFSG